MKKRTLLIPMLLLGLCAALTAAPPAAPPLVSVEKIVSVSESAGKSYPGYLEAIEEVEIRARVSGVIDSVKFGNGELVEEGQLLFEIEDTTYRASMMAASAQVDQIKAELKYAEDNYNRQKTLLEGNAASQSSFDEAQRLLALTRAKLMEAEASLLDATNNLSYCKIYSPISGRIGKATYTHGNYVTPASEGLANIVQMSPIHVSFAVSEPDYLSLFGSFETMRDTAQIRLTLADGSAYPHTGQVAFIDNRVDVTTNTLNVWATFDNPEGKLLPDGYVTVTLSKKVDRSYPAVRLSAIMTASDGNYIYIVNESETETEDGKTVTTHTVERRPVTTGPLVGSLQVLLEGAEVGETAVVGGTNKTAPGGKVNPFWTEQQDAK